MDTEITDMDVLIILPPTGFIDEEVTVSIEIFNESKVSYELASIQSDYCRGISGMLIKPEKSIQQISPIHYSAILVIGGQGSQDFLWKNDETLSLLKDAYNHREIIAGINAGVGVLANAGVLDGKKATTSPSPEALETISSNGGLYVNNPVVVDENIITAQGPSAMLDFMVEFLDLMGVEWYTT